MFVFDSCYMKSDWIVLIPINVIRMDISFISYKHLTPSGSPLLKNNTNTGSFGS